MEPEFLFDFLAKVEKEDPGEWDIVELLQALADKRRAR